MATVRISKSQLKSKMLEVFRQLEETGDELIVTDRGRPVLKCSAVCAVAGVAGGPGRAHGGGELRVSSLRRAPSLPKPVSAICRSNERNRALTAARPGLPNPVSAIFRSNERNRALTPARPACPHW